MAKQAGADQPANSVEAEKFRTTPITASITRVKSLPKSAIIYQCAASQFWQFRVFLEGKQRKRSTKEADKELAQKKAKLIYAEMLQSVNGADKPPMPATGARYFSRRLPLRGKSSARAWR